MADNWRQLAPIVGEFYIRQFGASLAPNRRQLAPKLAPIGANWRQFANDRQQHSPNFGETWRIGELANLKLMKHVEHSPNGANWRKKVIVFNEYIRQLAPTGAIWRIGANWRQLGPFGANSAPIWRQFSAILAPIRRHFGANSAPFGANSAPFWRQFGANCWSHFSPGCCLITRFFGSYGHSQSNSTWRELRPDFSSEFSENFLYRGARIGRVWCHFDSWWAAGGEAPENIGILCRISQFLVHF